MQIDRKTLYGIISMSRERIRSLGLFYAQRADCLRDWKAEGKTVRDEDIKKAQADAELYLNYLKACKDLCAALAVGEEIQVITDDHPDGDQINILQRADS